MDLQKAREEMKLLNQELRKAGYKTTFFEYDTNIYGIDSWYVELEVANNKNSKTMYKTAYNKSDEDNQKVIDSLHNLLHTHSAMMCGIGLEGYE